jgi:hypothetical protein
MNREEIIMAKWAIMVCLNEQEDDWIYVTEQTEHCWDLKPVLFNNIHKALKYSEQFVIPGKEENVQVVIYESQDR